MRKGPWFFAPPAGSDSGLRPPQGQSRCKIMALSSFYCNYENVKQIIFPSKIILSVSHILKQTSKYLFFYWNRLRAPSLGGEDRIYYFRATYIHLFWNRTGLFYFRNTLYTYLFWISTHLFYFPEHPIHIPISNYYTPVLFFTTLYTHTHFELVHACSFFRNTLYTYLFWISTRLFYFSKHPIHIPILN